MNQSPYTYKPQLLTSQGPYHYVKFDILCYLTTLDSETVFPHVMMASTVANDNRVWWDKTASEKKGSVFI